MRCAEDIADYLRDPHEACLVEPTFAAFATASLFGLVVWGRPGIEQARMIVRARAAELGAPPHELVLDYRLVEVIDVEAFQCVSTWLAEQRDALARVTSRAALVLPAEPYAAATVAGFYRVVEPPYPSLVCGSIAEAEAWLGVAVVDTVAEIHEVSSAGHATASALASLLEKTPGLGLDDAAAALGTSARTLQRRLQREGTAFVRVARTALVRRAKHLLATTDRSVAEIAAAVGCSSVQHFTEAFGAEAGVPPATWRARSRKR